MSRYLMIVLIFVVTDCISQNYKVVFSHDISGNRIKRSIEIEKLLKIEPNDSITQYSNIQTLFTRQEKPKILYSLYPNPTQGYLDLKITGLKDGKAAEYFIISIKGQELMRNKTHTNITSIDISSFPPGT